MTPDDTGHVNAKGAFSVAQFCRTFGIGRTRFYEEIKAGRLEARKIGAKTLVTRTAAQAWLDSLPRIGSAA